MCEIQGRKFNRTVDIVSAILASFSRWTIVAKDEFTYTDIETRISTIYRYSIVRFVKLDSCFILRYIECTCKIRNQSHSAIVAYHIGLLWDLYSFHMHGIKIRILD